MKGSENFMRDAIRPAATHRLTYWDGMRFGFGFIVANLLILALVAGAAYGAAVFLHLN